MQVRTVQSKIGPIAVVTSDELLIKDLQSALDLIKSISVCKIPRLDELSVLG
jgi:hypothetical protein